MHCSACTAVAAPGAPLPASQHRFSHPVPLLAFTSRQSTAQRADRQIGSMQGVARRLRRHASEQCGTKEKLKHRRTVRPSTRSRRRCDRQRKTSRRRDHRSLRSPLALVVQSMYLPYLPATREQLGGVVDVRHRSSCRNAHTHGAAGSLQYNTHQSSIQPCLVYILFYSNLLKIFAAVRGTPRFLGGAGRYSASSLRLCYGFNPTTTVTSLYITAYSSQTATQQLRTSISFSSYHLQQRKISWQLFFINRTISQSPV